MSEEREICILEHITKNYKMGELVTPVKDINLTIKSGDFICIEGPSGTGKSTLLYVIGTLLEADEGRLRIDGKDVSEMSDEEKTDLRATKIGFIFQDSNMIQSLTLSENLEFVINMKKKVMLEANTLSDNEMSADALLESFGLGDRKDYLPHQLSGGQKRRAMTARALIASPELILADEPTNDLDEKWAENIVKRLKQETEKGSAVVMVTHNNKWSSLATDRYRLDEGRLNKL